MVRCACPPFCLRPADEQLSDTLVNVRLEGSEQGYMQLGDNRDAARIEEGIASLCTRT